MTTLTLAPLATYPVQQTAFGPVSIGNGLTSIKLEIQRCTSADLTVWADPLTVAGLSWEFSTDGGSTWFVNGGSGFTANGGVTSFRGSEQAFSSVTIPLPAGTNRRIRGVVTISGGSIKTSVSAEVT